MKREFFVVETNEVEKCGMKVMHMDRILHDLIAQFVRGSVNVTWLDTATRQPASEAVGMMSTASRV